MPSFASVLFGRRKSIAAIVAQEASAGTGGPRLKRTLGAFSLTSIGVAGIIGTGIFVLTGQSAAQYAGPAIVISFVLAGFISTFAAFCYAEFASIVPVAGSAYTYAYATLGEIFAWVVGWALVLEYAFGAATVGVGWSGYFNDVVKSTTGHALPMAWITPTLSGGIMNLPAVCVLALLTFMLIRGTKESVTVNNVLVTLKVLVVIFFIVIAIPHIDPANWHPFFPNPARAIFAGIPVGASVIFFAYIGFDMLTTAAEESANPGKDLPLALILSLLICTVLYIAVSGILTGIVPYTRLNVPAPVSTALLLNGIRWGAMIVSIGAVLGLTTVLFIQLFGQARILFSLGRDGLLPTFLERIHPRLHTPWIAQLIIGAVVMAISAVVDLDNLAKLVNMGTLFAFTLVAIGVWMLRRSEPDLPRKFRTPALPVMATGTIVGSIFLMLQLPWLTKFVFLGWMAIGLTIYFAYGRSHSKQGAGVR